MKELSIEEKAKAYDEALKVLHKYDGAHIMFTQDLKEEMFPELREESEDERIRKSMTRLVKAFYDCNFPTPEGFERKDLLAWLEKQGKNPADKVEPKFHEGDSIQFKGFGHNGYMIKEVCGLSHYINTMGNRMDMSYTDANFEVIEDSDKLKLSPAWNEEDEKNLRVVVDYLIADNVLTLKHINWLKSLKDRVQPKQEWGEEDENRVNRLIAYFEDKESFTAEDDIVYANWLKSLKDRYTWKPSDKQMKALWEAYKGGEEQAALASLWSDLKKLKRE